MSRFLDSLSSLRRRHADRVRASRRRSTLSFLADPSRPMTQVAAMVENLEGRVLLSDASSHFKAELNIDPNSVSVGEDQAYVLTVTNTSVIQGQGGNNGLMGSIEVSIPSGMMVIQDTVSINLAGWSTVVTASKMTFNSNGNYLATGGIANISFTARADTSGQKVWTTQPFTSAGAQFQLSQLTPNQPTVDVSAPAKADQTINFPDISDKVYGDVPFALNVTGGGSGNPVTFEVEGPASITDGILTITGAGKVTVTASQAGNDQYYAAEDVSRTFQVAQAPLTITALNQSKTYDGSAFTGFTVCYDGFVNGEGAGVLGGTLGFGGSAVGAVNAGSYTITPGGLTSDNYAITFVDGTLTIHKETLSGDVQTQDALNLAKQGILNIRVSDISGFAGTDTIDVLQHADFYIMVNGQRYEFVADELNVVGSEIFIKYRLKNSALAESLAGALEGLGATSGSTAVTAGFAMETTNYRFSTDYLTRLFSTIK